MTEYMCTWGDPDSPTVVLLPGAGGTQWLWTPHAESLSDEYRVIAVDMPAHGTHPDASFSFDRAIEDVGVMLDTEGPAVLVGHSLGGHVAMEAASTHNRRVDGLLVAGVTPPPGLLKKMQQLVLSYLIEAATHSTRVRDWMDEQYGLDDDRQVPPDALDTHDAAIATARGMRKVLLRDSLSALERYEGPTVLAYGKDETDATAVKELAERSNAQLRWYEGGHGVPSRKPGVFTELVSEFLDAVYDSSRTVTDSGE